ncbi:UDP-N-acetylmuramoyl-L-alanine--D-glutamate ligase [Salinicola aestuarinus]|uniref:UDP-N-acetylmuramoyl-L-alanine--D-glutamate ligase n=1 Tax=Salinicola aestuarinus TaxID=1949082 RepID=UPI000DA1C403|nr:UDP-N-acetylmuramoyl-L-alanine--D-glutamate ligase [Salinicola aestuarinus]
MSDRRQSGAPQPLPGESVESRRRLVVGLGLSGRAIARYLHQRGAPFSLADTRDAPPGLDAFRAAYPQVDVHLGGLEGLDLDAFDEIVVSPGVDTAQAGFDRVRSRLMGEIELFVRECRVPIVAITGSNAKSTVTTLVGEMLDEAGIRVAVGGNLGEPALDLLLDRPDAECFVLELSSFQLESLRRLGAFCAAFLNLSPDHLDRHGDIDGYRAAKARIFGGARHAVVNADDAATWPETRGVGTHVSDVVTFSVGVPAPGQWGVVPATSGVPAWLARGDARLMPVDELALVGRHHFANALAAAAIAETLDVPWAAMRRVLARFRGLAHRGELIVERAGVRWINDSKGTNVGATLAAIDGVGGSLTGRLIWLGGGVGKGADFAPLAEPLGRYAREAILFGEDAARLASAVGERVATRRVATLQEAMRRAASIAEPGDCVLLSPACASLDQFPNYMARGDAFRDVLERGEESAC